MTQRQVVEGNGGHLLEQIAGLEAAPVAVETSGQGSQSHCMYKYIMTLAHRIAKLL